MKIRKSGLSVLVLTNRGNCTSITKAMCQSSWQTVKLGRQDLEIMLNSATGITESPKKMNVSALMQEMVVNTPTTIELDGISHMNLFQRVTVNVKVLDVKEVETVGDKHKHDVIVV